MTVAKSPASAFAVRGVRSVSVTAVHSLPDGVTVSVNRLLGSKAPPRPATRT